MADRTAPTVTTADPPDERGTLDVRTRAIQHIAEQVVLDTPGTVAHHGALGRLVGGGTPRADVTAEGRRVRIEVDVAAVWPCDVTVIATQVRDRVLTETARLAGVPVSTVDVTIRVVDATETTQGRSRVQ